MSNFQPVAAEFNQDGTLVKIWGPNSQVAFDPSSVAITGGVISGVVLGTGVKIKAASLSDYSNANPLILSHRGNGLLHPELTAQAYIETNETWGLPHVDMDVQALSDGTLGVMHDTTIDRTTTGTGTVVSQTPAAWAALAIDAATSLNVPGFGDLLRPPFFKDLVQAYRGRAIISPEPKATGIAQAMVDALLAAGVPKPQVLFNSFTLSDLTPAIAAGYVGMLNTSTSTGTEIANAQAAGVTWVAPAANSTDVTNWVAAGFKVLPGTTQRRYLRDQYLGLGAIGVVSDDAVYVSGLSGSMKRDTWASGKFMPGQLAANDGPTVSDRGSVQNGRWGWTNVADVSTQKQVLQGWAGPLTAPSFSVSFKARINAINAGDTTRWFNIFVGDASMYDRPFTDGTVAAELGIHCLSAAIGRMRIILKDGATSRTVADQTFSPLTIGTDYYWKLTITPTSIRWAQVDVNGVEICAVSATDSSYRNGYLHLGKNGSNPEFSSIAIT